MNSQVGDFVGAFDGDVVGLAVVGETVGFLLGEAELILEQING